MNSAKTGDVIDLETTKQTKQNKNNSKLRKLIRMAQLTSYFTVGKLEIFLCKTQTQSNIIK